MLADISTDLTGISTWAEIDLDALRFNLQAFANHIGPSVQIIAAVKANAYGHGAVAASRTFLEAGATILSVHRLIEGIELRNAGITAPILVLGSTPLSGAELLVKHYLTQGVASKELAEAISGAATRAGCTIPVHLKLDTGMSRYGVKPEEALRLAQDIKTLRGLQLEGIFTHLATADSKDKTSSKLQIAKFQEATETIAASGINIPLRHAANSAASMCIPESHFDAIRPGIALYGLQPSSEWPSPFQIRPALTLKSRVSQLQVLPPGTGVSYGSTFVTTTNTRVALIPLGYGDGYHRILSGKGQFLIRGKRAPILGRICMDQCVVDVSHIPGVELDDEVVAIGRQGDGAISAEELASLAGTINYEATTSLLPRVVRAYCSNGRILAKQ